MNTAKRQNICLAAEVLGNVAAKCRGRRLQLSVRSAEDTRACSSSLWGPREEGGEGGVKVVLLQSSMRNKGSCWAVQREQDCGHVRGHRIVPPSRSAFEDTSRHTAAVIRKMFCGFL
jgi:hypothetical protein